MIYRAAAIWLGFVVLAVLNGATREAWITPHLGEQVGHVVSTVVFCSLIFGVSWLVIRWIGPRNRREALWVGLLWVALTCTFEFLAGHYLFGHSWQRLFADYNLFAGRVWIFVLIATLIGPVWAMRARRPSPA